MRFVLKAVGILIMLFGFMMQKVGNYTGEPDMQNLHVALVGGILLIGLVVFWLGGKKKNKAVRAQ